MAGCEPGYFTLVPTPLIVPTPNQLLGGGTQRLRLVLQVSPWRGIGLGLWMGRGTVGQGNGLVEKGL